MGDYQKGSGIQAQFIAQWITSLAISVICCAVLFVVFAGYIVDLHEATNLTSVRLEVLMERHNQMANEFNDLKRMGLYNQLRQMQQQTQPQPAEPPAPQQVDSNGVTISEPAPPDPSKAEQMGITATSPMEVLPVPQTQPTPAPAGPAPVKPQ